MIKLIIGIIALSIPAATASALPSSGVCEVDLLSTSTKIEWRDYNAAVHRHERKMNGSVIGMREHEGSFKFSVIYDDDIFGESEIMIFHIPMKPEKYRITMVSYEYVDDIRVLKFTLDTKDANCIVFN